MLTRERAIELMEMQKFFDDPNLEFPQPTKDVAFEAHDETGRDLFTFIISRNGHLDLLRCSYVSRTENEDENLAMVHMTERRNHRNPDGTLIMSHHLHLYSDDPDFRIAVSLEKVFPELYRPDRSSFDMIDVMKAFCSLCHFAENWRIRPVLDGVTYHVR